MSLRNPKNFLPGIGLFIGLSLFHWASPALAEWATVYAEHYNGRPTASGEIYSDDLYTAAHPSLPLGTYVIVYLGDRSVEVKINDRCYCDIDLSWAAAQALGMIDVAEVTLEVLDY